MRKKTIIIVYEFYTMNKIKNPLLLKAKTIAVFLNRPWTKDAWLSWWAILFLCACFFCNSSRPFLHRETVDNLPRDFINVYCGARLLLSNTNPYNDSLIKITWQSVASQNHFKPTYMPGLPDAPLLYPPFSIAFFLPFAFLPYRAAYSIWWALILLSVAGYCLLLPRIFNRQYIGRSAFIKSIEVAMLLLTFKTTFTIMLSGQPCVIFFFASIAALWADNKKHTLLSGLMLGLAAIKINIALPVYLVFYFRKSWKPLIIAFAVIFANLCIFLFSVPDMLECFDSYFTMLNLYQNALLLDNHLNYSSSQISSLVNAFTYPDRIQLHLLTISLLFILFICAIILYIKKKKPVKIEFLFLSFFAIALLTYVKYYDFAFLAGLGYFYLFNMNSKYLKSIFFIINLPLFVPVVGLILQFNLPMNFFTKIALVHLPLIVVADSALIYYYILKGKSRMRLYLK